MDNIKEAIRKLAENANSTTALVCTVDSVDEKARTIDCTPIDEGAPLLGVNLQANQGSDFGLVLFPKVGSYVVVGFIAEGSAGVMLLADEVEKAQFLIKGEQTVSADMDGASVTVKVGDNTSAVLTKDGIVMNGGDFGGHIKIQELTDKINDLVSTVNKLISDYNGHTHTGNQGAPTSPPTKPFSETAAQFSRGDYENEKVKH